MSSFEDPRLAAFCATPGLWRSVAQAQDIWQPDPFDVTGIHAEARQAFSALLDAPDGELPPGRILLVLGDSGAGKTHLLRAFRNQAHQRGSSQVAYMQMTPAIEDYPRYLLDHTVVSLEKPYLPGQPSGLLRLSGGLFERAGNVPPNALATYRHGRFSLSTLRCATDALAVRLASRYPEIPLALLRALILAQRRDPVAREQAASGLRSEPARLLDGLARLAWQIHGGPLVLCLDQLENVYDLSAAEEKFRHAVGSLASLADQLPGVVLVVACLSDLYARFRSRLTRSFVDRLERDPKPVSLRAECSAAQVRELLAQRLRALYPNAGIYPFPDDLPGQLAGQRLRDVFYTCSEWQAYFRLHGHSPARLEDLMEPGMAPSAVEPDLSAAWRECQRASADTLPEVPETLLQVLEEGLAMAALERGERLTMRRDAEHAALVVDLPGAPPLLLGACQQDPRWLSRQIETLRKRAGKRLPVALRVGGFPNGPATLKALDSLEKRGGWQISLEPQEWRILAALGAFRREFGQHPAFADWLRQAQPVSSLRVFQRLLDRPPGSSEMRYAV